MNTEESLKQFKKESTDPPNLEPWTLDQGLKFIQGIETFLCWRYRDHQKGALVHCALGGSVIHKGKSDKDLDIFIYPHQGGYDHDEVAKAISEFLETEVVACCEDYKDEEITEFKDVRKAYSHNKRIDFFFL